MTLALAFEKYGRPGRVFRIVDVVLLSLVILSVHAGAAPLQTANSILPREIISEHTGSFAGREIAYKVVAGETILRDAQGKPSASLFTFSYLKTPTGPAASRPVLFVFNGGPGSSSMWLHMGFLGPRKLDFPNTVSPRTTPPFPIIDNPLSPFDQADLVFIDPVGTGFSTLLPEGRAEDYLGVIQDAAATAQFIQAWLTRHQRWDSPKFLVGESYGTIRAAVLANTLMGGALPPDSELTGITLNGVILLGPGFESGASTEDRQYASTLPAMSATACYHGKVYCPQGQAETVAEKARVFAGDAYLRALYMGSGIDPVGRRKLADRLASLTGVSAKIWMERDLRLSVRDFSAVLLADEGKQIGLYDSRYTLPQAEGAGDPVADDASMSQYTPGFIAAFNGYLASELTLPADRKYIPIAFSQVNFRWNWGMGPGIVLPRNYAPELAKAMRRNPSLRLFVAAGDYDLVTPAGSAEFAINHSAIPRDRVTFHTYPSGHMLYLEKGTERRLASDLRKFLCAAQVPVDATLHPAGMCGAKGACLGREQSLPQC